MKCPRCVQLIHRSAEECPHCGLVQGDLDIKFSGIVKELGCARKLNDVAGVLRFSERKKATCWLNQFERNFPQLFFSVYYGALGDGVDIRQFGMWLLNRSVFKDVKVSNEGCVLLVVDMKTKRSFMAYGYLLDSYLSEDDTFEIMSKAHPYWLKGEHYRALKIVIKELASRLRKKSIWARFGLEKNKNVGASSEEVQQ